MKAKIPPENTALFRAFRLWPLAPAFLVFALFGPSAPAFADTSLVEASPQKDEVLSEPPEQVRLHFAGPVEAAFDPVKVSDKAGSRVDLNDAEQTPGNPEVVVATLEQNLRNGRYQVAWRVTGEDGHTIEGEYSFVVESTPGAEPTSGRVPVETAAGREASEGGSGIRGLIGGVLAVAFVGAAVTLIRTRRA